MEANEHELAGRIAALIPPLLHALEVLAFVSRHLHPPLLPQVMEAVGAPEDVLRRALDAFRLAPWRGDLEELRTRMGEAGEAALAAFAVLREAAASGDVRGGYRATRRTVRALEALYPVAGSLPAISRFFLEPMAREDAALAARLAAADPAGAGVRVGVMHAGGEKGARGGYSIYVPEYYDPSRPWPLVMALHGGSGNGGAFLWSWLAEARSRGMILVSPTALGDTWSLMEPETDSANIERILGDVRTAWNVDPARLLLTGMSDGGTFTFASGLRGGSRFTHLAPIAASFHPLLLMMGDADRVRGLPLYIVHGSLDWMFPASRSRDAAEMLSTYGARAVYREIADLSHTYPRDENPRILDWFMT